MCTPGLVGDHLSISSHANIRVTQFYKTHGISYRIVKYWKCEEFRGLILAATVWFEVLVENRKMLRMNVAHEPLVAHKLTPACRGLYLINHRKNRCKPWTTGPPTWSISFVQKIMQIKLVNSLTSQRFLVSLRKEEFAQRHRKCTFCWKKGVKITRTHSLCIWADRDVC